jgi:cytochrome b
MTVSAPRTTDSAAADATLAVPVWDLPIRLFHWSLVLLITFSWWSAENGRTQWHLWSGYAVLFLLLFRILWGFLGSSTARFTSFFPTPARLLGHLRDPAGWRGTGHTPLGGLSVIALLALITLQVLFGLPLADEDGVIAGPLNRLVSFDTAELAHEVHEALFNVLLALIALHIAAIIFYRLRGKRLVGAMLSGRTVAPEGMVAAPASRLLLCLGIAGAVTAWVASGLPGL